MRHQHVQRVSFSDETSDSDKRGVKRKDNNTSSDDSDTDSERECNLEVFQTFSHKQENLEDEVMKKRPIEVTSITLR